MTASGDEEKRNPPTQHRYVAILTIPTDFGRIGLAEKWTVAAKGQRCDDMVTALQSLLEVTATALAMFQKTRLRNYEIADGTVDEILVQEAGVGTVAWLFGL